MSDVDRAVTLWKLERLCEKKGCQHLVDLSVNKDGFIQKILTYKKDIMSIKSGSWMFDEKKNLKRNVEDIDIGELCVIVNKTDLKNLVETALIKNFNTVKGVRNYLAHKGQEFGVDESNYQPNLEKLKACLNRLRVQESIVDEILRSTASDDETDDIKEYQVKTGKELRKQIMEELREGFIEYNEFNITKYIPQLVERKVLTRNDEEIILHEVGYHGRNNAFWREFSNKKFDKIKIFVDLLKDDGAELAEIFEPYL